MKKSLLLLITSVIIINACTNATVGRSDKYNEPLTENGVRAKIDRTCQVGVWSQKKYNEILDDIDGLIQLGMIDDTVYRVDNALRKRLHKSSSKALYMTADSLFGSTKYDGVEGLRSDLKFLCNEETRLESIGADVAGNAYLDSVETIFANYDNVKYWVSHSFEQTAKYSRNNAYKIKRFDCKTYDRYRKNIEGNHYYNKYFKNNESIAEKYSFLPDRLQKAKKKYYSDLEKLIEDNINNNLLSMNVIKNLRNTMLEFDEVVRQDNNVAVESVDRLQIFYKKKKTEFDNLQKLQSGERANQQNEEYKL